MEKRILYGTNGRNRKEDSKGYEKREEEKRAEEEGCGIERGKECN